MNYDYQKNAPAQAMGVIAAGNAVPRMGGVSERFERSIGELLGLSGRLVNLADRVCGSVPTGIEKDAKQPNAASAMGRLENLSDDLEALVRQLHGSVTRLELL
jgi:hypothetical protein